MRHRKRRRLKAADAGHRRELLQTLSTSLFRHERIRTTLGRARIVRPFAEKLITKAREGGLHNRRLVARHIHDQTVLRKLFDTLGARYAARPGGYSRILKLGGRKGDGAEIAILELVKTAPASSEKKAEAAK